MASLLLRVFRLERRRGLALLVLAALAGCGRKEKPAFYYDLGPDSVDVSGYPDAARAGYLVFREKCSRCHTLARPLNAPYTQPAEWLGYYSRMLLKSAFSGKRITTEEKEAIQRFLAYDTLHRKVRRREEFERQQQELKRRFAEQPGG